MFAFDLTQLLLSNAAPMVLLKTFLIFFGLNYGYFGSIRFLWDHILKLPRSLFIQLEGSTRYHFNFFIPFNKGHDYLIFDLVFTTKFNQMAVVLI